MNREEALDYIDVAAEERILGRIKHSIDNDNGVTSIKADIEFYESVMQYVKENLK